MYLIYLCISSIHYIILSSQVMNMNSTSYDIFRSDIFTAKFSDSQPLTKSDSQPLSDNENLFDDSDTDILISDSEIEDGIIVIDPAMVVVIPESQPLISAGGLTKKGIPSIRWMYQLLNIPALASLITFPYLTISGLFRVAAASLDSIASLKNLTNLTISLTNLNYNFLNHSLNRSLNYQAMLLLYRSPKTSSSLRCIIHPVNERATFLQNFCKTFILYIF